MERPQAASADERPQVGEAGVGAGVGGIEGWQSETVTKQSDASADKIDVFDEAEFTGYTSTTNVPEKGITYNQTGGAFTFVEDGVFEIAIAFYLSTAGTDTVTLSLEVDTDEVWSASPIVHSAVDPTERSTTIIVPANAGDELHAFAFSDTATLIQIEPGTTVSVKKIG